MPNALVGRSLAKQIDIDQTAILAGKQLSEISDMALFRQAVHIDALLRRSRIKTNVLFYLQKSGNVVGFMGYGIIDAPAFHN